MNIDNHSPSDITPSESKLRVLLLENLPVAAEMIRRELHNEGFCPDLDCVVTGEELRRSLSEFLPDIILSGIDIPGYSGVEILSPSSGQTPSIPFVMITGVLHCDSAYKCLKPVHWESLLKDRFTRIVPAIRAALEKKLLTEKGRFDRSVNQSGYPGNLKDKPEKNEIEEVLRKLSRAVEQSTTAILITDTTGLIEYANKSFAKMTGFAIEDTIGRSILDSSEIIDLVSVLGKSWQELIIGGERKGESRSNRKDGVPYWSLTTFSPITDSEDVTTHFLVEMENITLRKETERKLEESRSELIANHGELQLLFDQVASSKKEWESTMDCIGDMLVLVGADELIRRCNKAFKDFVGLPYVNIIGSNFRMMFQVHGLPVPEDFSEGIELFHKSSSRWFLCSSYPFVQNEGKEISGSVVTLHDFTEQKRVGQELEEAYEKLKATQAKVVQQEKMASIGQLAAGVAHEINNPMGFISSNLGSLQKYLERMNEFIEHATQTLQEAGNTELCQSLTDKRRALKIDMILQDLPDLISESQEGAERVRTIVQNLKSFSRVDETSCKAADINECIESTVNIVWNELKYKVKLIKEYGEIPMTRCYPQQINQVFMNLLMNGAQAIESQGEIRIRTWSDDLSIFASVADTGCGMPEAVICRIFEPFFTTKEVGKGTGLGLSITYDIIKNHKGDIAVESEPGVGTTFTIRIPVVTEEECRG